MTQLEIGSGRTKSFDLTITDDVGLVNLTGKPVTFSAKYTPRDPDPAVITKVLTPKDQGTNPGEATLRLTPAETGVVPADALTHLVYQIDLNDGGDRFIVEEGILAVFPAIDR